MSDIMKIFSCLSWMQRLCELVCEMFVQNRPVDTVTARELPSELIVDILSRLPADCVVPCVHGSKTLLKLTKTPSFVRLHLKRASPVIAFQYYVIDEEKGTRKDAREVGVNFIDTALQKVRSSKNITIDVGLGIHKMECRPTLYGSYYGFLMFKNIIYDPVLFLWNPATDEQVTISAPYDGYCVRGLFFHPTYKDHRALFVSSAKDGKHFEYFTLSLKTKSTRLVARSRYEPSGVRPPVIVNGKLHWMIRDGTYKASCANSIVSYDIKTKMVSTMKHPGFRCQELLKTVHTIMKLMEKDGKLWFVNDMEVYGKISMWMLVDYERGHWVEMHYIELKEPFTAFCCVSRRCKKHELPEVFHIFEDEVLMRVFCEDLYIYSLQEGDGHGNPRTIGKHLNRTGLPVAAVIHVGTLLSLHTDKLLFLFGKRTKKVICD